MIVLFGSGAQRGSLSGQIMKTDGATATVRPRFAPRTLDITFDPAARVLFQENLDLDTINIGDTYTFEGRVTAGDARTPTGLAVRTITRAGETAPKLDEGDNPFFGGRVISATVTGKVVAFEPLRVQTQEGREVVIRVPGQLVFATYRPLERSSLKDGQKAFFLGRSSEGKLIADLIIVNPQLAMGPGF
jgi:hypothetical protein